MQYEQSSSNVWSFVLSAPGDTNSYIAIGFSSNGKMVGSSAVVGWSSNGTGVVKQYYLGGTSPRLVEPDKGNLELLPNSSSIIAQSSRLYLTFQLETNLPLSRLIYSVGPDGIFPAAPNYILTQHRNKVSTSVNYNTGKNDTPTNLSRNMCPFFFFFFKSTTPSGIRVHNSDDQLIKVILFQVGVQYMSPLCFKILTINIINVC